jgi:hypothetical protein
MYKYIVHVHVAIHSRVDVHTYCKHVEGAHGKFALYQIGTDA